ncbi:MAG: PhzF family phenazine biosynthesis protein, partial [Solirubrobacteraceae bacterium]|nr:PhzF family phenazine biosynthesis protein [Solirubrobacteraceae bacterium]
MKVDVVRVFCDARGEHGNPLGVVLDGAACADAVERQEIAFELGFAETVFIDDRATGSLRIFTPDNELPLAGHPLVGTAWLLAERGTAVHQLRPPAGVVPCGLEGDVTWIDALPKWAPPWRLVQVATPDEVDAIDADAQPENVLDYAWAWIDEPAGLIRARSFVKEHGIVEDEATGS